MSILNSFALNEEVAVVTGAGKGIGRGIALALAEAGAKVLVSSRTAADLAETVRLIEDAGGRATARPVDITTLASHDQLAEAAITAFGKVSIWVNNAGGLPDATPRYLTRTSEDHWDAQMSLNLKATWASCVAAAKAMQSGGSIINISSRASFGGHLKNGPYSAAKAAVNSLTQTFALELAPRIRVNAVAPGPIPTQNFKESIGMTAENAEALEQQFRVPLGRFGTPADIGGAVVFLASPAASWITGQCLYVTGGY
ncbi:MAG: SDR family oxidoreductase [Sphingomonadaceae bacterium]|nr:SDR family oxidoreductase [Sphingomonadaceae bacterium]